MIETKNLYYNEYLRLLFLLKLLAFLHLILTSYTYKDSGVSVKFSENKNNVEGLLGFIFHRSLAEQESQEKYHYTNMNDKLIDDVVYNNEEYGIYYVSPYEQIRKRGSNNMGVLQRNYKNRFEKKRGLAKLDHYFEKAVFHKLDDIYYLANKWNCEKKILNKRIFKKYGIRYILICSIPLLGLIIPTLLGFNKLKDGILPWCGARYNEHQHANKDGEGGFVCELPYFNKKAVELILFVNNMTFIIITFIILFMLFYTLIKIIKYERIKSIKGKMSLKEYCNFCKDIIRKI